MFPLLPALGLVALTFLGGCHVHVDESPPPAPFLGEVEPNDTAWQAVWLGALRPGDRRTYTGHVGNGYDPQDGFRFTAPEPCALHFVLQAEQVADLDLCLYDPYLEQLTACFDSPDSDEQGTLVFDGFGTEFHLVVLAAWGESDYTLSIAIDPPFYGFQAAPPAEAPTPVKPRTAERIEAYRDRSDS